MKRLLNHKYALLIFISSLILAAFTFDDYGISWDEFPQHEIGSVSYDYVKGKNDKLLTFVNRDYGPVLETALIYLEYKFKLVDYYDVFLMRHFVSHFIFLVACFFFYLLIYELYQKKILACIGYLALLSSPLFYSHSFFNTKDIPFAMVFIFCFYFLAKFFKHKKIIHLLLLAFCLGILINLRIMGVILLAIVLFWLVLDLILALKNKTKIRKNIIYLISFCITTVAVLIASWPYLWSAPYHNFIEAFENMSKFRWDGSILLMGEPVSSIDLPWYYIPVWFLITNPIFYLLVGIIGSIWLLLMVLKKPLLFISDTGIRNNLTYLACFVGPVFAVIVLHSVLYDAWRQLFFIYPSFILLFVFALSKLIETKLKKLSLTLVFINFVYLLSFAISNHPNEQVYFNEFLPKNEAEYLRKNFEMDYWGVNFKQSLEYLLENDKNYRIKIAHLNDNLAYNLYALPKYKRDRIAFVEFEKADYYIVNYRWHPQDYEEEGLRSIKKFKVYNSTITEIFRIKRAKKHN